MRSLHALRALLAARSGLVGSLGVVLLLALGVASGAGAAGDGAPTASELEQARLGGGAPAGAEVVGLRTEHSRSFRRADGTMQTRLSLAPRAFRDAEGTWRVIDPTLRRTTAGIENTAGPMQVDLW